MKKEDQEKALKRLFDQKWKSFLNFEKKEYSLNEMYYWERENMIVIFTGREFIKFKICNEDKIKKTIQLIIPFLDKLQ